jgi:aspartate carbamoyltransferase catalytic subunit
VNRGVELAAETIDSDQALIGRQVEAGVVVRMAVLYELLASPSPPAATPAEAEPTAAAPAGSLA